MGTPSATKVRNPAAPSEPVGASESTTGDDRLSEIDTILAQLTDNDRLSAADAAGRISARQGFLADFATVCNAEVRPAMTSVLEQLEAAGGAGLIEEHPGGEPRFATPRLTLWMSLQGEIVGSPRLDSHPYLQLDADVTGCQIQVSEGDMWGGRGGHSGSADVWQLSEVTQDRVIQELLSIVRRAAAVTT